MQLEQSGTRGTSIVFRNGGKTVNLVEEKKASKRKARVDETTIGSFFIRLKNFETTLFHCEMN